MGRSQFRGQRSLLAGCAYPQDKSARGGLDPRLCVFRERRPRLGPTMAFPLRTPSPFWSARGLGGQPRWFYGGGGRLFFRGSVALFREDAAARLARRAATGRRARRDPPHGAPNGRRNPRPQSQGRGSARPKHERKGGHGPRRLQGASRCSEDRNRRRDRRTCWQGRPPAKRSHDEARQGKRTVRSPGPPARGPARCRYESPARRRLRCVPKSRRPGSASPAWKSRPGRKGPGADFLKRAQRTRLSLRPRPRREAMPPSWLCYEGFRVRRGEFLILRRLAPAWAYIFFAPMHIIWGDAIVAAGAAPFVSSIIAG